MNRRRASSRGSVRRPAPASARWVSASGASPSRAFASARRTWVAAEASSGRPRATEISATARSHSAASSRRSARASASFVSAPSVSAPPANSGSAETGACVARSNPCATSPRAWWRSGLKDFRRAGGPVRTAAVADAPGSILSAPARALGDSSARRLIASSMPNIGSSVSEASARFDVARTVVAG